MSTFHSSATAAQPGTDCVVPQNVILRLLAKEPTYAFDPPREVETDEAIDLRGQVGLLYRQGNDSDFQKQPKKHELNFRTVAEIWRQTPYSRRPLPEETQHERAKSCLEHFGPLATYTWWYPLESQHPNDWEKQYFEPFGIWLEESVRWNIAQCLAPVLTNQWHGNGQLELDRLKRIIDEATDLDYGPRLQFRTTGLPPLLHILNEELDTGSVIHVADIFSKHLEDLVVDYSTRQQLRPRFERSEDGTYSWRINPQTVAASCLVSFTTALAGDSGLFVFCSHCGKAFKRERRSAKFCSDGCKTSAHRLRKKT